MKKLLLGLALAATATFAQAGDIRNYPASACKIKTGSTADYLVSSLGFIRNTSTTEWLHLTCPLARDTLGGNIVTDAAVYVVDTHDTENIKCALYLTDAGGYSGGGGLRRSSGYSFTPQKLTFTSDTFDNAEQTLYFNCSIPPKMERRSGSWIASYSASSE